MSNVKFSVGFKVDKAGLVEVQKMLQEIQLSSTVDMTAGIQQATTAAGILNRALNDAFDQDTGKIDLNKFNQHLLNSGTNVEKLKSELIQAGTQGQLALSKLNTELALNGTYVKQNAKWVDDMLQTFANTARWTAVSAAIRSFQGSVESAFGYVKSLNSSLRDIQVVSGYSSEYMREFAESANEAAKAIGLTTLDFTEAALIYIQQGKREDVVEQLADITLRAAQVVGTSTDDMSEFLTAVWNGFQIGAAESEEAVDKLAAVAANTGADLEELATGMSKVASVANSLGMDLDQLNAALATVITVTRQAPESVGTAFKTILARLEEVKLGETLDDGVTLGQVATALEKINVQILDQQGELRDIGVVLEEVGNKWHTLSKAQQNAVAIVMAGKRQYNNLVALFENWDMYMKSLNISANSLGTLQEQHEIYLESITAYEHKLNAEMEALYSNMIKEDAIIGALKAVTSLTEGLNGTLTLLGGIEHTLPLIMNLMTAAFSPKIALNAVGALEKVQDTVYNIKLKNPNFKKEQEEQEKKAISNKYEETLIDANKRIYGEGFVPTEVTHSQKQYLANIEKTFASEQKLFNLKKEEVNLIKVANEEQLETLTNLDKELQKLEGQLAYYKKLEELNLDNLTIQDQNVDNFIARTPNFDKDRFEDYYSQYTQAMDSIRAENLGSHYVSAIIDSMEAGLSSDQIIGQIFDALSQEDLSDILREDIAGWATSILNAENYDEVLNTVRNNYEGFVAQQEQSLDEANLLLSLATQGNQELQDTILLQSREQQQLENNRQSQQQVTRELERQNQERQNIIQALERQARIERNIKMIMAAGTAIYELSSIVTTFSNEEAKAVDKVDAMWSGVNNTIAGVAYQLGGPLVGTAVTAGLQLVKAGAKALGIWDSLVESFKLAKERLDDLNSSIAQLNDEITGLEEDSNKVVEQLERLAELRLLRNSNNLTSEEKKELSLLEQQEAVLKQQQQLIELNLKLKRQEVEESYKQAKIVQDSVRIQGERFGIHLAGNTEEIAQQLTESANEFYEKVNQVYGEINSGAAYNDLSYNAKEVVRQYGESLDEESKRFIEQYRQGIISVADSPELKALLNNIDPTNFYTYKATADSLKEAQTKISTNLQGLIDSATLIDENSVETANLTSTMLAMQNAFVRTSVEENQIAKDSLKGLESEFIKLELNKVEVSGDSVEKVKALSQAMQDLENGLPKDQILQNLKDAGVEIDDSLVNLESNVLSLAGTLSNDLRQSLYEMVTLGQISEQTFAGLSGVIQKFADIAGTSSVVANPDAISEAYDKMLEAESFVKTQQIGSQIEGWETVAGGTRSQQLAFIREAYEKETEIQKRSLQEQQKNLEEDLKVKEQLMNEAAITYETSLSTMGGVGAEAARIALDKVTEEYIQTKNTLEDVNNQLEESIFTTAKNYKDAFALIANEGDILEMEDVWSSLKDIPDFEDVMYEGSMAIMQFLYDGVENTNQAIQEEIAEIDSELEKLEKEKTELNIDDGKLYTVEKQIENLENRKEELSEKLTINVDFETKVSQLETIQASLDDFYNSIHDGKTLVGGFYQLNNEQLEYLSKMYPQALAEYAQYKNGMLVIDQKSLDNFIAAEDAKQKKARQTLIADLQNLNTEIDAQIAIIDAELAAETVSEETLNSVKEASTEFELGLEQTKQQGMIDTGDTAADVASDISINFTDSAESGATAIANMADSGIKSLQELGKEARAVAEQLANPEKPVYEVTLRNAKSTYTKPETFEETKTAEIKTDDTDVESYEEKQVRLREELTTEREKLISLKAQITALMGRTLNTSGLGGGRDNRTNNDGLDDLEYIADIYHYINKELERQDSILAKIDATKDTLYGKDYLNALDKEIESLEIINKLNGIKLDMQKEDLAQQKQNLANLGAKFNEDGLILNYNELLSAKVAAVNGTKGEDERQRAEKSYEDLQRYLDEYEETLAEFYDAEQTVIDGNVKILEDNLNKIVKRIEFDLQPTEDTISYLEFLNSFYENDYFQSGESVERMKEQYLAVADSLDIYKSGIEELQAKYADSKISAADFNEEVRNQRDALQDAMLELVNLEEAIKNAYGEALGEAEDKLSKYTKTLEHYNGTIEHFISIMDLIGEGHEYSTLAEMYDAQSRNYMEQLGVQQNWLKNLQQQKNLLEATGQEGSEAWFEVRSAIEETEAQIYSLAEQALGALRDSFKNTVDSIVNDLDNALTNSSIQNMLTQYERDRDLESIYYDKPTQLYEIDSLQRDIADNIDDIANKYQKQQLQNLYDELDVMRELDQIGEYDLERKRAQYELLLAQIALEDAQNAKNNMRLTRTSQGTWEYTFTADAAVQDQAQGKVNDAYNNLYQMSLEHMHSIEQSILDTTSEYEKNLVQLYKDWADGKFESEEEFFQARDALTDYYEAKITDLTEQYNRVRVDNVLDAEDLIIHSSKETGDALLQQIEENKNQYNEAVSDMADKIGGPGEDSFRSLSNATIAELDEAWLHYNDDMNKIKDDVSLNLDEMTDKTMDLTDESSNLADIITSDVVPAIQDEIEQVIQATAAHQAEAEALREKINAYLQYLSVLGKDVTGKGTTDSNENSDFAREALLAAAGGNYDAMNNAIAKRINKIERNGTELTDAQEKAMYAEYDRIYAAMEKNAEATANIVKILNKEYTSATVNKEIDKLLGLDTGGYTGDWGSTSGKLALLHEKELVLNESDTSNMLDMIKITRQVVSMANKFVPYQSKILNGNNVNNSNIFNNDNSIQQSVIVNAEFPNATSESEIRNALLSIATDASQYANRKR